MLLLFALLNGHSNEGQLEISPQEKDVEIIQIAFDDIKNYAKKIAYLCQKKLPLMELTFKEGANSISVDRASDLYSENLGEGTDKRCFLFANNLIYKIENI